MHSLSGKHLICIESEVSKRCAMKSVKVPELFAFQLKTVTSTADSLLHASLSKCHKPNAFRRDTVGHLLVNGIKQGGGLTGSWWAEEDRWFDHINSNFLASHSGIVKVPSSLLYS